MNEENKISQPGNESENPSNVNEITDQDLEQVSGGLNSPSTGQHLTKISGSPVQDKWAGNNLGKIKPLIYDDESPKE
jgi:bacteriocin-like protein